VSGFITTPRDAPAGFPSQRYKSASIKSKVSLSKRLQFLRLILRRYYVWGLAPAAPREAGHDCYSLDRGYRILGPAKLSVL
jgi:hypothetical protein